MVTLETADKALKTVYLGVISNQLNVNTNPLFAKIKQSSTYVTGKEVRKVAPFGINGGIGAGTEEGPLPLAGGNNYVQFVSSLKNLYGTIEISDKAIRASQNNASAFVNLLNAEMEGLIKASAYNFSRMLYGNGLGYLCEITSCAKTNATESATITLDSVTNIIEGLTVDIVDSGTNSYVYTGLRIVNVNKGSKTATLNKKIFIADVDEGGFKLTVQNSYKNEITGIEALFDNSIPRLYGVEKTGNSWLNPYTKLSAGAISDVLIQTAIDTLEENTGSDIDFITCSSAVKRAYQSYLSTYRRNIDTMELNGGFRAISYGGIPILSDKFVGGQNMYLLNTKEFTLHQLCDWQWLEGDDGSVLKQKAGYPAFTATLVKYAELICDKPCGQGKISGITIS